MFAGKFYHVRLDGISMKNDFFKQSIFMKCIDDNGMVVESVNISTCYELGETYGVNNDWTQASSMNFNDVIDSYYSLLQVSTFKGWIAIISDAVDSTVSSFFAHQVKFTAKLQN